MTKILLLFYSQSGEAARAVEVLSRVLSVSDVELVVERIVPTKPYPSPWRSPIDFFGVLSECHLGPLPKLEPVGFASHDKYDLIILVYQVWFLAPSLPIQSLLNSPSAEICRDAKVITGSVSRAMWHSASETMKRLLASLRARHIDNISLTHQGPAWATFVAAPRALLTGRKDGLLGVFPPAGLDEAELARLARLATVILNQRERLREPDHHPLLNGVGATRVKVRSMLPEFLGFYYFRAWAYPLRFLKRAGKAFEAVGITIFIVCLAILILVGIPIILLIHLAISPWIRRWSAARSARLREPSDDSSLFSPAATQHDQHPAQFVDGRSR